MMKEEFVDFYELLEVSPNATQDTIERVFRFRAKRLHPDVSDNSNVQKFSQLVEAYETLRDPETRAAYDIAYDVEQDHQAKIVQDAENTTSDTVDRLKILSLFYAQRRRDMRHPGMGVASVEQMMDCPQEILEFHLWYFREKGWIQREESGQLSITAAGVDHIEAKNEQKILDGKFLTEESRTRSPIVRQSENGPVSEIALEE